MDPTWLSSEKGLTSANYSKDNKICHRLGAIVSSIFYIIILKLKDYHFFLIKKIRVKFNFQTSTSDLFFANLILYFKK